MSTPDSAPLLNFLGARGFYIKRHTHTHTLVSVVLGNRRANLEIMSQIPEPVQAVLVLALHGSYEAVCVQEEFREILHRGSEFLPLLDTAINLALPLLSHPDNALPLFLQQGELGDKLIPEAAKEQCVSTVAWEHCCKLVNMLDVLSS